MHSLPFQGLITAIISTHLRLDLKMPQSPVHRHMLSPHNRRFLTRTYALFFHSFNHFTFFSHSRRPSANTSLEVSEDSLPILKRLQARKEHLEELRGELHSFNFSTSDEKESPLKATTSRLNASSNSARVSAPESILTLLFQVVCVHCIKPTQYC